jgi:hypothetical protein
MQTGNTPPTWQSDQPQLQNQQYPPMPIPDQFQYPSPPPNNVPPKRTSGFKNWFRTRSQKTKLGLGLIIVALLLSIFAVYTYGSSVVATKVTPAPTTTGNTGAGVSPGATNSPTLQHTLHTGTAILGAQLSTFTAKFGQQNDHSSPGQIHLARCGNSNTDQLILSQLPVASSTKPITSILYASCSTWTISTAESLCSKFFPADAIYQKTVIIPGSASQFPAFDKVYYSATLAREFGAVNFTDANKNPVKPGLFDVSYLYENSSDTTHIGSCNVQLGTRQMP